MMWGGARVSTKHDGLALLAHAGGKSRTDVITVSFLINRRERLANAVAIGIVATQ